MKTFKLSPEFEKDQREFKNAISTNGKELGIEDELVNMRFVLWVSGGMDAVKAFDEKLKNSLGQYQDYLMGLTEMKFTPKSDEPRTIV